MGQRILQGLKRAENCSKLHSGDTMYGLKSVQLLNIHTQETYFYMMYQDPFGSHQVQQRHFGGNPNKHDNI